MKVNEHAKHASHTKRGPGRYHTEAPTEKTLKQKRAGAYGRGLRNWITNKQDAEMANRLDAKMRRLVAV